MNTTRTMREGVRAELLTEQITLLDERISLMLRVLRTYHGDEFFRASGKIEGMKIARSYLEETLRMEGNR